MIKFVEKPKRNTGIILVQPTFGIMCRMISISNAWLIANKKTSWKTVYNSMSSSNIFQNPKNALLKTHI